MHALRFICTAALGLTLVLIAHEDSVAQELREGDRIRVQTVGVEFAELVGVYDASEPDFLVMHSIQLPRIEIPWDNLSRLELSRGEHSNSGKGALIGLGVGGAAGLALGIAAAVDNSGWFDYNAGHVVLTAAVFGAFGAGVGALIGMASKSERWEDVPRDQWRIQVTPDPKGGVAIGLNLRL